jgi:hypothetical protein
MPAVDLNGNKMWLKERSGFPYNLCWKTKRKETHMDDTTFCIDALAELFYKNLLETEDLGKHVKYCGLVGHLLLKAALIKNLARFDDELMAEVPKDWKLIDRRQRTVITMLGEISYARRVYQDTYGTRRYLLDEVLGIASWQRIDPDAFLWIVRRAADVSYEKTARAFNAATGAHITRQTVMRCVHRAGELLAEGGGDDGTGLPLSAEALFVEFDGFWVDLQSSTKAPAKPRRTYKEQFRKKSMEMKAWVAYGGKDKKTGRRLAPVHWASDAGPSAFFAECTARTQSAYVLGDIDWLICASDAAGWCKAHGLEAFVKDGAVVISRLDTYHVNQKLYRAFSSEDDRDTYLKFLYSKDFEGFFKALDERMTKEPTDERAGRRAELYAYIENNLEWLRGASISSRIRKMLSDEAARVFADRPFCAHLQGLIETRRYKRLLGELEGIASRCRKHRKDAYKGFLADAKEAVRLIRTYGPVALGTMEGTNSKVYAARLKVWGCAWSARGALAMMRIRATLASGHKLLAPRYDARLTDKEKGRIEAWRRRSVSIPDRAGSGWEPPQGSVVLTTLMPPVMQAILRH